MIRDKAAWEAWENKHVAETPVDFHANLRLVEAMYDEARALGVFPTADPLEGLEVCVKLARTINVSMPSREDCAGT